MENTVGAYEAYIYCIRSQENSPRYFATTCVLPTGMGVEDGLFPVRVVKCPSVERFAELIFGINQDPVTNLGSKIEEILSKN